MAEKTFEEIMTKILPLYLVKDISDFTSSSAKPKRDAEGTKLHNHHSNSDLSETMETRWERNNIFKVHKDKKTINQKFDIHWKYPLTMNAKTFSNEEK